MILSEWEFYQTRSGRQVGDDRAGLAQREAAHRMLHRKQLDAGSSVLGTQNGGRRACSNIMPLGP